MANIKRSSNPVFDLDLVLKAGPLTNTSEHQQAHFNIIRSYLRVSAKNMLEIGTTENLTQKKSVMVVRCSATRLFIRQPPF